MNPGQRDILSDREPPEHHSEESITGDGIYRMQERGTRKREKREERPRARAAAALTWDRGGDRERIFKRPFHFSHLRNQVALSPLFFFIFSVVVTGALYFLLC